MRHWQRANLAPDRTNLVALTSVETCAFVEDATAHSVALYVVIVAVCKSILLFQLVLGEVSVCGSITLLEVFNDFLEGLCTCVLLESLLCNVISWLVAFLLNLLAEFLVVNLVAVFALDIFAKFLSKFRLQLAHRTDGVLSSLQCSEQVLLRNLFHLAFHHHDVLCRRAYHNIHVGLFHLLESRINNVFAIDACYTNFTDRTFERNI